MQIILLTLDQQLDNELARAAWSLRKRKGAAAASIFAEGLSYLEKVTQAWYAPENEVILRQLDATRSQKEHAFKELIEVDGKIASFNFAVYEAYRQMSNVLMAYSGVRAKAERLASVLRERGIECDLSPGLAPNYDRLASEYLFRDNLDYGLDGAVRKGYGINR